MSQELQDRRLFAAEVAARGLQRCYRGWKGRERVSLILWTRFETAATMIQHAYRRWHDEKRIDAAIVKKLEPGRKVFRRCKRNAPLLQRLKLKKDVDNQPPTSVLFHKCLRGVSNHDNKMAIWRAILELRRGHPTWSTHTAFKAMIEARGDITRALTLMSDETFALKNEGDVPMQLQLLFIPSLPNVTPTAPSKGDPGTPAAGPRATSPIAITTSTSAGSMHTQFPGTGLAGLRSMRGQRVSMQRPNALDFSQLLVRSYFSKYYAHSIHMGTVPCRKPLGFEPHMLAPKSPNADGTLVTWESFLADRSATHQLSHHHPSNTNTSMNGLLSTQIPGGSGSITPSRRVLSAGPPSPVQPSAAPGSPGMGSFPLGAQARDTELLSNLLELQQKMDSLR